MTTIRIKICGITRPEDGRAAADAGADAIGLVFHGASPRNVTPAQASEIIRVLPPFVTIVGLFLDAQRAQVEQILDAVPLDVLQFHGRESAGFCRGFGRPYIKAVGMNGNADAGSAAHAHPDARALLFDSHEPGRIGGSGRTFAWDRLPAERDFALILAGGLTADNVARGIRQVRPDAVDVSSGVESAPGIKDSRRIGKFIKEARSG